MEILVVLVLMFTNIAAFHLPANDSESKGRIFKGFNASKGQFPYVVAVESKAISCGGALIGREWVLTAAHCVHGQPGVYLFLGVTKLVTAKVAYYILSSSFVFPPGWDFVTKAEDVALINIPTTYICDDIFPVPLPSLSAVPDTYVHEYAIITGWGVNGNSGSQSDRLQWTRVLIVSNANCVSTYGSSAFDAQGDLCVGTIDGSSACVGDSGDPLVLEDTPALIGILSSGTRDCEKGDPIIFTRITSYLFWIEEVTGISY